MTWLATAPDCDAEDSLCRAVLDATGNAWLATAADWLLAKPLVIVSIVALGFLVRWLAVRFIRRLTTRAAAGVFPTAVLRGREEQEDQYGVGDEVVVGETTGVVEALSLRVTRIRGEDDTIWYLRNGEILKVGNRSQRVNPAVPPIERPASKP